MTRIFQDREVSFECIEKNQRMIGTLTCSLCWEIFKEPYMTDCGHNFCSICLSQVKSIKKCNEHDWCILKECPLCRKIVHPRMNIKNINLKSSIDALQVRCLQKVNGIESDYICGKEIYADEVDNHLSNDCTYCPVNCKYQCGYKNYRFLRDEHERSCLKNPETKINCPKCSESVFSVLLKEHKKNDCRESIVSCTVTYLCKKKIKRCELEEHVKNESFEHINLLKQSNLRKSRRFAEQSAKWKNESEEKDKKYEEEKKRMKENISSYFCTRPEEKYISIPTWLNAFDACKKFVLDNLDGKQPKQQPKPTKKKIIIDDESSSDESCLE